MTRYQIEFAVCHVIGWIVWPIVAAVFRGTAKMKRFISLLAVAALSLGVAACDTTGDAAKVTAKTFDTICASEPAVYAAYVTVAVAKKASDAKLAKAEAYHLIISDTCANPPTNLASAVSRIALAYAAIVTARGEVAKLGA